MKARNPLLRRSARRDRYLALITPAASLRSLLCAALFVLVALAAPAGVDRTVLYDKPSLFGSIIVPEEENGLRVLRFEQYGARQSVAKSGDPAYLGLPYAKVVFVGLALCEEPRRVLVVGLGGSTLPMFLRRHYPNAAIDAVDIDPEVVRVAKQFFGFREDGIARAYLPPADRLGRMQFGRRSRWARRVAR